MSEWVGEFNGLSGDIGQQGPYSPYKPCKHSLYIGIIIFPHTDNTSSTGRPVYRTLDQRVITILEINFVIEHQIITKNT